MQLQSLDIMTYANGSNWQSRFLASGRASFVPKVARNCRTSPKPVIRGETFTAKGAGKIWNFIEAPAESVQGEC